MPAPRRTPLPSCRIRPCAAAHATTSATTQRGARRLGLAVARRLRLAVARQRGSVVVAALGGLLVSALAACGSNAAPAGSASPSAPAAAGACSPSVTLDGFSDALDKTSFGGTYVGNLSALAVSGPGPGAGILALSDRSALFTLDPTTLRPTAVVALHDEQGKDLDSEGLAVEPDGTLLVTSEVEPSIRHYTRDGTLLGRLPVPPPLLVAPAGRASRNLTFEGLTLRPGGTSLVASMEAALAGDQGNLVRFQTWTRDGTGGASGGAPGSAPGRASGGDFRLGPQYGYLVEPASGVSEIAATVDGRLLVLERGYLPGFGNTVRLYLADPGHASDTSGVDRLAVGPDVHLVGKTLLADISRCPSMGAKTRQPQPNPLLDNIEGMTAVGRDPDGTMHLLLVSDDNHNLAQTTRLYRLTVHLPR